MNQFEETLLESEYNLQRTENGALGYMCTGKALLDLNFAISSLRNKPESATRNMFADAYAENPNYALAYLMFARDIRGGMGERRFFRIAYRYVIEKDQAMAVKLMPLVAEYGRWDDLIMTAMNTRVESDMVKLVAKTLAEDLTRSKKNQPVTLLAKWMPSYKASDPNKRIAAARIARAMDITPDAYMKMLKHLRNYLKIVEGYMSRGEWDKINYEAVPSKANLIYNSAFLRHDETRRRAFLGKLEKGEAKINAGAVFPHDVAQKYMTNSRCTYHTDPAIEAMWKSLPDFVKDEGGGTMVVADGSGSMFCSVANTRVSALTVANSLAIYFAERMKGAFRNTYITFSNRPQLVRFNEDDSLRNKLATALRHNEVASTNIEGTFNLILNTAIRNHMTQDEMPRNVLILSDMEFNTATSCRTDVPLFKALAEKFEAHGYKLPRLVFWNLCSRTMTIPVRSNDAGVALVSGFSPAIADMVLSGKTDPYEILIDKLVSARYKPVWDIIREA